MKIKTVKGDPILNIKRDISAGKERDFAIRYCPFEETHWSCNLDHYEVEIIDIPNKRIFEDFVRYWVYKLTISLKKSDSHLKMILQIEMRFTNVLKN